MNSYYFSIGNNKKNNCALCWWWLVSDRNAGPSILGMDQSLSDHLKKNKKSYNVSTWSGKKWNGFESLWKAALNMQI